MRPRDPERLLLSAEAASVPSGREKALLVVLVAAAAALRLYGIGRQSLWIDELFATCIADLPVGGAIQKLSHDCHPPLYFLLLKAWRLLGESDGFSRALSALFGV